MAPGIYKTFKKALKDNLDKYLQYSNNINYDAVSETKDTIEDILNNMKNEDLDKLLLLTENTSITIAHRIIVNAIKDTEKQCYQAMEGIIHNLNTLNSRAGAQVNYVA